MKLTFSILDTLLEVSGTETICALFSNEFDCLLFPPNPDSKWVYQLEAVIADRQQLNQDLPAWAAERLGTAFLKDEEEGIADISSDGLIFKYSRVKDGSSGMLYSTDLRTFHLRIYPGRSANGEYVVYNFLVTTFLRMIGEERGYLLFHCAALADVEGRTALFLAHAGTGKTTVALALMKRGFRLLNDDLAFVGGVDELGVHGVLEKVNFTKWTAERFPECAEYFRNAGLDLENQKQPLDVRKIYGDQAVRAKGKLKAVFVLNRNHGEAFGVRKLSTAAFLSVLRDYQIRPMRNQLGTLMLDMVTTVNAYEIHTGSDPFTTAELIEKNWASLLCNSKSEAAGKAS